MQNLNQIKQTLINLDRFNECINQEFIKAVYELNPDIQSKFLDKINNALEKNTRFHNTLSEMSAKIKVPDYLHEEIESSTAEDLEIISQNYLSCSYAGDKSTDFELIEQLEKNLKKV